MTMQKIAEKPLAIVGMACRLPGAENLDEFWSLLREGRSQLGQLPHERFNHELRYDPTKSIRNKSYASIGGIVPPTPFDHQSCPIPQRLVDESHDMHLRLCAVAATACRHAGLDPFALPQKEVGVYIGHTPPSSLSGDVVYARLIEQTAQYLREIPGFNDLAGGAQDTIIDEIVARVRSQFQPGDLALEMRANAYHAASVISQGFNLHGPAMCFDAACASSFRAFGHAVRALQFGHIDMAIVGSASYCHSDTLVQFSQAQSLSANKGTCPFDNDADGLIASEGYVAIVIKTLEQALADGDPIQSVIRRVGISSDGKGKSLWAPRAEGQAEAIRRAYGHDLSLDDLQYIEMHATSTQVGDATEIEALSSVFKDILPPGKRIPVGSVKANVGHTLESAGLTSLVKTVLAVQNKTIPPQINIKKLNEKIDWENIPFYVPQQATAWDAPAAGSPRRAAVNTFGIGGLNVHVVLDEHLPEASRALVAGSSQSPVSTSPAEEGIAVVGMGAVLPGARTIDALWDAICSGQDQKSEVPPERWDPEHGFAPNSNELWRVPTKVGGFINDFDYDWKRHKVPPKQVASADPLQFMLLDAADQALKHAGYDTREFDKLRTGVIVGTIFCGEFANQLNMGLRLPEFKLMLADILRQRGVAEEQIADVGQQYEDILLKHMPALIDETGSFTASTLASRITKTFDLMGGATAVDSGDTSSMSALASAIDLLMAGDCDMMLCAAGHREMGLSSYESMSKIGLLSKSADPKGPFDANATGCVPGEGVGVLILKRLSDAQRDGDTIHGVIRGISAARENSLDDGVRRAATRSLEQARVSPQEVGIVEAGSSGMPASDEKELRGLATVYGSGSRDDELHVGALAGQVGNTQGASGLLEVMKALAELNHGEIPANIGPSEPADVVKATADKLHLADSRKPVRVVNSKGHGLAGISNYSQFDLAYHVVVEGGTKIGEPAAAKKTVAQPASVTTKLDISTRWRIVRIAGASLSETAQFAAQNESKAADLYEAAEATTYQPSDRCRLAVVAESAEDLASKLKLAGSQLEKPAARQLLGEKGIFYGEVGADRPKVAFVFPGQGSQYDGMLQTLVDEFPPAAAALKEVDAVLARLELPSFAELAWEEANGLGTDVWRTQLSLLAADTIVYAAARAVGLQADRVAGHSFGELAALTAAGSWTFDEGVRATHARCKSIDACEGENGIMVSTSAPAEVLEQLCSQVDGRVSVSHLNAPEQTVAGGDEQAVRQLAEIVEKQGYKTKILDVPAAFHTPLLEGVKRPFRAALEEIQVEPPRIPLLSSVTNKYVSDPEDIRDNLAAQMTCPVNWRDLATRLADDGVSVVVEVGPRQVLTGLNRQTLVDRNIALVGCDHPKRNGLAQLLFARACVETTGALDSWPETSIVRDSVSPVLPAPSGEVDEKSTTPSVFEQHAHDAHAHGLNVVQLTGSPYEIGLQHGRVHQQDIRTILRRYADLAGSRWERMFDLDDAVSKPEVYFSGDELEELKGIAKGANVTLDNIIAHNLRLYFNAATGGVHFALSARANPAAGLIHAANEDLAKSIRISDCLSRNIQTRRPEGGIPYVTFGVVGQVGSLNGINAKGVAVSTATLNDVPNNTVPRDGLLHTVLVKRILEQAEDIDSAVAIIRELKSAGTWGMFISHYPSDSVSYVEFDGSTPKIQPAVESLAAANHRLLHNYYDDSRKVPPHSEYRLERIRQLLGDAPQDITVEKAQNALRDRFDLSSGREAASPTINTVRRIDNQISIVMQPGQGNLWVTGGPTSNGYQNKFTQLRLDELLPELPACKNEASKQPAPLHSQPPAQSTGQIISPADLDAAYAATPADGKVCSRFKMRAVEAPPVAPSGSPAVAGAAIILGDNHAAHALQQQLQSQGTRVTMLPVTSREQTLTELENIWAASQPLHLFLMTPHDAGAVTSLSDEPWNERRERGVTTPYAVCQRWYQLVSEAGSLESASLVAATTLGGDFGFSGNLNNVESGALSGLLKGVDMELKMQNHIAGFRTKVVDTATTIDTTELARLLLAELASGDGEIEVGYIDGRRCLPRPVSEPVEAIPATDIPQGATFVITGGARGVTAVVARELGRRYGAKLHLIGSSPVPDVPDTYLDLSADELKELRGTVMKEALANGEKPLDAWGRFEKSLEIARTIQSFADEGIHAVYHSCDISNRELLSSLLDTIRAADGPISGVIHGAGYERACRFEKKEPALVNRTIAAKVDGAAALMELTKDDPVRFFAGFGSVSGRFGGVGQTDYCVANDMLSKLIDWYRGQRTDCSATVFHWHAWDDVGMAVRPESKHIAKLHNIVFMPSLEGVDHLFEEIRRGLPEGEIVVTELSYCRDQYGDPAAISDSTTATSLDSLPLVDGIKEQNPGRNLIAEIELDPVNDPFLAQHRYKKRPMLPVVVSLEALAEASSLFVGDGRQVTALRDIELLNGLRFLSDDCLTARLNVTADGDDLQCELTADFVNRKGLLLKADQSYLRCRAEVSANPAPLTATLPEPPGEWTDCWYPEDDIVIYHGPVFRTFRQMAVKDQEAWATLHAPDLNELTGNRQGDRRLTPSALLDGCFFASGVFLWWLHSGVVAIPARIDKITIGALPQPGEKCTLHMQYRGRYDDQGIFDFTLFGESGQPLLAVDGYHNIIVSEAPISAS